MPVKPKHIALVIIDQQQGIDNPRLGPRNNPEAGAVMQRTLRLWRDQRWPVIHVRHRSQDPGSVFGSGGEGFAFKPEFSPRPGEYQVEKTTPCALTGTNLHMLLAQVPTQSLLLMGASTNNSVEATARTGGNLGLKVYVLADGCFAFDKRDYNGKLVAAEDVHALSLANLQGEYAQVITERQLRERLGAVATAR